MFSGRSAWRQPCQATLNGFRRSVDNQAKNCLVEASAVDRVVRFAPVRVLFRQTSAHLDHTRCRVVQNSRSKVFSLGCGRLLLSTATCCRRARISIAVSCRLRKKTRSAPKGARMKSTMNTWCSMPRRRLGRPKASDLKPLIPKYREALSTDRAFPERTFLRPKVFPEDGDEPATVFRPTGRASGGGCGVPWH